MRYLSSDSINVRSAVFLNVQVTKHSFERASLRAANEECEESCDDIWNLRDGYKRTY
jgi:hypothetical protein